MAQRKKKQPVGPALQWAKWAQYVLAVTFATDLLGKPDCLSSPDEDTPFGILWEAAGFMIAFDPHADLFGVSFEFDTPPQTILLQAALGYAVLHDIRCCINGASMPHTVQIDMPSTEPGKDTN